MTFIILGFIIVLLFRNATTPRYTIQFDVGGGTHIPSQKVMKNEKIERPEDPEKEGYVFLGWYYQEESFDFDTMITQDMELEAHWRKIG